MSLNCYQCAALSAGCGDPFNKDGSGVSETGENSTNKYCKVRVFILLLNYFKTSSYF